MKKNFQELEWSPTNEAQKSARLYSSIKRTIMMYEHNTSRFITPNSEPLRMDHLVFALRSFRLIVGFRTILIPEDTEEDLIEHLWNLLNEYTNGSMTLPENVESPKETQNSQDELKLLQAKEYLLEGQLSSKQIALFTGLKITQVNSLKKRLSTTGEVLPFKTKRSTKLNEEHLTFIIQLLNQKNGCLNTLSQIKTELLAQFPLIGDISQMTIHNALKKSDYVFKRVSPFINRRNYHSTKADQKRVSKQLISLLSRGYKVIFVDETGIKLNSCPNYGWGLKGQKISVEVEVSKQNYSIMAAITDTQVLGCQIIEQGGTTKQDFLGFLCTVIDQYVSPESSPEVFVFLDNATWHTTPYLTETIGNQINFIFNAAYSPMLNPIEEFFSKFKKMVKKKIVKDSIQLEDAVRTALMSFTQSDFQGYMKHALMYAYHALNDEDLS